MSEIYKKAREFAKKHIDPYVARNDENKSFAVESFKEIANEGYFSLVIPKEYGGKGLGIEEHAEICMAFAESSASVGLCYMMSNVALFCLNKYGSEELKKEVFKSIVEEKKFAALAYSELGSGTHFYLPDTTAIFGDGEITLNGLKSMVTSGGYASYYLVLAQGKEAIDNWCIPLETKGLEFLPDSWNGIGMRANVSCQMKMD
ncbi:MAG: acyl-CoA/acyl-ACP dehydrogenase, partial [Campylobacter sp.]|nr:acyl-CoA/acyl-ACP dehydrogenase [Campylobacter sp.]